MSGDAKKLVLVDEWDEKNIQFWDVASGKKVFQREFKGQYNTVALSPDNKVLIVGGNKVLAHLIDTTTGKETRRLEWPDKPAAIERNGYFFPYDHVYWFTFSPDGKKLASTSHKAIQIWDVKTGKLEHQIRGSRGRTAFSPDGKYLASGDEDRIRLYEVATGKRTRSFEKHCGWIASLVFSADGKTIASGEDHTVTLWDVQTGKRKHPFAGHEGIVNCLAFSPDGKTLASGGNYVDPRLIVWDLSTRKPRHHMHFDIDVLSLAFSPDGETLAAGDGLSRGGGGGWEALIRSYKVSTGKLIREFPAHINSVQSLAFSPDGKKLGSCGNDARVKIWVAATGKRRGQIRGPEGRSHFHFSADGKHLAIANSEGELALWDANTTRKIRDFGPSRDGKRWIGFVAFLPDGKSLLSRELISGEPLTEVVREVCFWDRNTGRLLRSFKIVGQDGYYACYTLSPDGKIFAAPADNAMGAGIRLWDTVSGELIAHLKGQGDVTALAFSADGKTLASGSRDTTILLWDVSMVRLVGLWERLAAADDEIADAIKELTATPEKAIPFLKEHLVKIAARETRLATLIANLDDKRFKVRQKATRELEKLGQEAELTLELALKGEPTPEASKRIQKILARIKKSNESPGLLNARAALLALGVLEEIGSSEARKALQELAKGPGKSRVTREAAAALKRLQKQRQAATERKP
jgi:WD40 repeat protein